MKSKLQNQARSNGILSPQEWLIQSVKYFRELGFFEEYHSLLEDDLTRTLENLHKEEWGESFDPKNIWADLLLLKWDKDRIWWQDTEADVCNGRTVYKQTLKEWAAISRETFLPERIQEDWGSEEGPVTITFIHNKQTVQLHPQYLDDYIDVSVLSQVNKLISNTGKEFAIYEPFDQTAFIVVLTTQEKQKLQKERDWRFAKI